ncbi:unnamed protein product [Closterium sp. Naga37s-1]|nr:unnamed protein product [Closterium sp. Naga37s-1]
MAGQVCVVTGGRGFVGRWLVRKLLATGEWSTVRVVDMAPELRLTDDEANGEGEAGLVRDSARSGQLEYISGNVCDRTAMVKAFQGASAVFHMASPNHALTDLAPHYTVNVLGTKNVIAACQEAGVCRLIFTSSASVATNAYGETKAQAEAIALAANGQGGLLTCALRPSNNFGPGDPDLVPITVKNAQKGKLKFIVGDGENMSDWTYVENVVHAHICAEKALSEYKGDPTSDDSPAGKVSIPFILAVPCPSTSPSLPTTTAPCCSHPTPHSPIPPLSTHRNLLAGAHRQAPSGHSHSSGGGSRGHYKGSGPSRPIAKLPADILIPLAGGVEAVTKALAPLGLPPSDFTPARLLLATRWRTFSPARAGRLLGYKPVVSVDEGLQRTIASYPHLQRTTYEKEKAAEAAAARAAFREHSSVHKALGGGVEGLQRTIASYPHLQRSTYEKEKAAEAAAARAAFRERSSVHKALGGGVVADLLLWQDAKLSLLAMLLAWMVLRWAIGRVGGTPVVSLAATAAMGFLLHAAVLHRVAPIAKSLPLPDMAAVEWRIPEKPVVDASQWVAATWNDSVAALQEKLLVERDWAAAGKVGGGGVEG